MLEDVNNALVGMLKPEFEEVVTGDAEVREVFSVPRRSRRRLLRHERCHHPRSKVRFLRDGAIIWKGAIASLRRFKDDVREVREGFECGIGLENYQDLKPGDVIETYDEEVASPPGPERASRPSRRRGGSAQSCTLPPSASSSTCRRAGR